MKCDISRPDPKAHLQKAFKEYSKREKERTFRKKII